jgi:hypothetical protein
LDSVSNDRNPPRLLIDWSIVWALRCLTEALPGQIALLFLCTHYSGVCSERRRAASHDTRHGSPLRQGNLAAMGSCLHQAFWLAAALCFVGVVAILIGYWLVCLPLGHALGSTHQVGLRGYWIGLLVGLVVAFLQVGRLQVMSRRALDSPER